MTEQEAMDMLSERERAELQAEMDAEGTEWAEYGRPAGWASWPRSGPRASAK